MIGLDWIGMRFRFGFGSGHLMRMVVIHGVRGKR